MRLTLNPFGKAARKKSRRTRKPRFQRRTVVAGLAVTVIATAVSGGWHLVAIGWPAHAWISAGETMLRGSAIAGLRVSEIVVEGRNHAARADLLEAVGAVRGMPILAFDPDTARSRIEKLGWVRRAAVARRLPDVVYIRIEERVPLAIWQRNGSLQLVDRDGTVIRKQKVSPFTDLPLIVGEDAPQHAAGLIDLLAAFPEIAAQTDAAIRVSGRRWNLRLTNGIDIRLPETGLSEALGRLDDFQRRQNLFDRDVIAVDLRKPDRLIVRVHPEARGRVGLDGKNT